MITEIVAAVQATKNVYGLVKAANDLSNHNELLCAVSEVNMKLTSA
jgi:hypothetical protein